MQRGCKSGENLISRDKSLNVPRSLARRRESTRSQPGMSLASSKPRRRRRRRRRPLTRFANFAFLHNLARERVIKFIHARERAVNRKAREKAMENFKIETRILSLSLSSSIKQILNIRYKDIFSSKIRKDKVRRN